MSWWKDRSLTFLQDLAADVIKCGPILQHAAFIIDGNRRYAKRKKLPGEIGHMQGFDKIKELTFWASRMGIREVTIYLFSIENFKRTEKELSALLGLIKMEFVEVVEKLDEFMKYDMCVRMIGNLDLLPKDVRNAAAQVAYLTRNNKTLFVNFAFSYTSRDEMTNAIKSVVYGVRSGFLETADIEEDLLTHCMYTNRSRDPEVLVRTGGDSRFSDFLLWQIRNTTVFFENVTWPEFSFWDLLKMVFKYQRNCGETRKDVLKFQKSAPSKRWDVFLKKLDYTRACLLEYYVNN